MFPIAFADRTPTKMNPSIVDSLKGLRLNEADILRVPVKPKPAYRARMCFVNCQAFLTEVGQDYEAVLGWDITTNSKGTLTELEYHCVVRNTRTGEMLDVTPHELDSKVIWFVPDRVFKWTLDGIIEAAKANTWTPVKNRMSYKKTSNTVAQFLKMVCPNVTLRAY